mgnify:CR=1 FL=1
MLANVANAGLGLPPLVVMHAQEKFGKTSLFAYAPNPIYAMIQGERGLLTLLDARQIPATAHYNEDFRDWMVFIDFLRSLRNDKHEYKTLVIDTGNALEMLCCDMVKREQYQDKDELFMAYHKGYVSAMVPWQKMLDLIDEIREKRRMMVVFLHHTKVKEFSDPNGKTWAKWQPEGNEKLWMLTSRKADVILFGGWDVEVKKDWTNNAKDEKATGQPTRYLLAGTQQGAVSGNRCGFDDKIVANGGAQKLWAAVAAQIAKFQSGQALPPAADPAKPAAKTKEKKTKFQTTLEWWQTTKFITEKDEPESEFAKKFAKAIDRLFDVGATFLTPPADHPDVREYVREVTDMSDMQEFPDMTQAQVDKAALHVADWMNLCKPEPAK